MPYVFSRYPRDRGRYILVVAGLAEEAYQQQRFPHGVRWIVSALLVYALPVGALYECGCAYVYAVGSGDVRSLYSLLLLGAVTMIAIICAVRCFRRRDMSNRTPDPGKWFLDQTTGEYHRITGYHGGSVVYEKANYQKRFAAYRNHQRQRTKAYLKVGFYSICAIAGLFCGMLPFGDGYTRLAANAGGWIVVAWAAFNLSIWIPLTVGYFFTGFGKNPGPAPLQPSSSTPPYKSNIYGQGSFARRDDNDRAGRGLRD